MAQDHFRRRGREAKVALIQHEIIQCRACARYCHPLWFRLALAVFIHEVVAIALEGRGGEERGGPLEEIEICPILLLHFTHLVACTGTARARVLDALLGTTFQTGDHTDFGREITDGARFTVRIAGARTVSSLRAILSVCSAVRMMTMMVMNARSWRT